MTYSVSKNGMLLNAGLNRQQAMIRLNREIDNALSSGLGVSVRGVNNDMLVTVTNGNTYEMRGRA